MKIKCKVCEKQIYANRTGLLFLTEADSLTILLSLTLYSPIPQNGQTHSSNSSAVADEPLGVFDHFLGLLLKVLKKDYKKFNPLVSGVHPKVIHL